MKTCTTCAMRYPDDATFCFVDAGTLVDAPDPRIGTLIAGRYILEDRIGEGGMATVFRARHKLLDRLLAVKIMNPTLAIDPVVRERFRREAKSAQKLAHPNIIEIYDQGDTEDSCYMAMELLVGESLAHVIQRGPMAVDRAVLAMIQIARGIARAHDFEVTHRDIKPENIFLCRRDDGTELVKLLDFGIARSSQDARLTNNGELFGTPQYMAPERITGMDTDGGTASDLYALGVVFYEMLTGTLPFDASDVTSFFVKHLNEPPDKLRDRNPLVPEVLDDLVLRMLEKEPKDRPDAHRVHQDLLEILERRRVTAPPKAERETNNKPAAITLDGNPSDPWMRRVVLFERMLGAAFGPRNMAPGPLTTLLDRLQELTQTADARRRESFDAQRTLEEIDVRGRTKRTQLGFAADQLGVDASRAREELKTARETLKRCTDDVASERARFLEAHRAIVVQEGRSGFLEPWPSLANAYLAASEIVTTWHAARQRERAAEEKVTESQRLAEDLDFQILALRSALTKHEQELDDERAKAHENIERLGRDLTELDARLVELTTRFCAPLREKPELAPFFKELESVAA